MKYTFTKEDLDIYLSTLDNIHKNEWYNTEETFAYVEIHKFMLWLESRQNKNIGTRSGSELD